MFDFTFHNPTKILFGKDRESLIGGELATAGIGKVLFLYGRESIKKTGLHGRVVASLQESGVGFTELGGVVSNPVLDHTREGVLLAKQEQVDAILAVGGGSVLDEAKAIAVGATVDGPVELQLEVLVLRLGHDDVVAILVDDFVVFTLFCVPRV